jgi:hypothetical protein
MSASGAMAVMRTFGDWHDDRLFSRRVLAHRHGILEVSVARVPAKALVTIGS